MIDLRSVAHPIGKIVVAVGAMMLLPMLVDLSHGDFH
jgi:trk system potassium uptake protein